MDNLLASAARVRVLVEHTGITRSLLPSGSLGPAEGDVLTVPVGCVAGRTLPCVHVSATVADLDRFSPRDLDVIPVVDDTFALRGVVHRHEWAQRPSDTTVAHVMSPAHGAIEESRPLRDAFVIMSRKHLRSLPVVTADGVLCGVLADLDALRWVAEHARKLVRSAHSQVA